MKFIILFDFFKVDLFFIVGYGENEMSGIDIIIPVYNEEESVEELIKRISAVCPEGNITFVDNASKDRTVERIYKMDSSISIIRHERNEGYGKSLIDGIQRTFGEKIILIDGDLEYPPEIIPEMIRKLDVHEIVQGSRFYQSTNIDISSLRSMGNKIMTMLFNALYSQDLTDFYTGIRGIRRDWLAGIKFDRYGFEFVVEISCKIAKKGAKFTEIPLKYKIRRTGQSKMRHIPESLKLIFWIFYYRVFK